MTNTENKPIDRATMNEYVLKLVHYCHFPNEVSKNRAYLEKIYVSAKESRESLPKNHPNYGELESYEKTARQLLMGDLVQKLKDGELN